MLCGTDGECSLRKFGRNFQRTYHLVYFSMNKSRAIICVPRCCSRGAHPCWLCLEMSQQGETIRTKAYASSCFVLRGCPHGDRHFDVEG